MKGVSGPIFLGAAVALTFGAVAGAIAFFVLLAMVLAGVILTFMLIAKGRRL
jgi:hypothetical protein